MQELFLNSLAGGIYSADVQRLEIFARPTNNTKIR